MCILTARKHATSQVETHLSWNFDEDFGHFLPLSIIPWVPGVSQEVGQREGASPEGGGGGPEGRQVSRAHLFPETGGVGNV